MRWLQQYRTAVNGNLIQLLQRQLIGLSELDVIPVSPMLRVTISTYNAWVSLHLTYAYTVWRHSILFLG